MEPYEVLVIVLLATISFPIGYVLAWHYLTREDRRDPRG